MEKPVRRPAFLISLVKKPVLGRSIRRRIFSIIVDFPQPGNPVKRMFFCFRVPLNSQPPDLEFESSKGGQLSKHGMRDPQITPMK